nr:MAG TPA: SOX transcription factor [Caudoviricetes sp.]
MVQGFYFALLQYSHTQVFTARFVPSVQLYRPRRKTVHRALQWLFLRFDLFHRP